MNLNIEMFSVLKKLITEDPLNFDLTTVVRPTACGTVGCLAGHLAVHEKGDAEKVWQMYRKDQQAGWHTIQEIAMSSLGIKRQGLAKKIFFLEHWAEPFKSQYKEKSDELSRLESYFIVRIELTLRTSDAETKKQCEEMKARILKIKQEMVQVTCDRLDYFVANGV
ncbi:MAG: hypothetical protein WBB28_20660 [Crinalium sp.]